MAEDADRRDRLARAKAALEIDASPEARARIKAGYEALCVDLVSAWVLGEKRFESQGQQAEDWIARCYEALHSDEQPDAARIYARFQLGLPRAQYLARLLRARRSAQWRAAARAELRQALQRAETMSREAAAVGRAQIQRFDLSLSRGAYDELVVLYDAVASAVTGGDRPAPPTKRPSSPTLTWFSITAETILALLDALPEETKP
ncbi:MULTISPECIES: hypothetical protein [Inquilinus]|uniref:Uncharacterized protein n=1 Tax=Inquilinus ginsengisoli TaxID=363840 RepID=A0ABU1JW47_9PROT|nr:hypothetical protein [Inquilinus ginsengisoli]MDR6292839.1 hypothetical protein [Inquilinus ginsengisoli]